MRTIPETANRGDWPRLVAGTINRLIGTLEALGSTVSGIVARTDYTGWAVYNHTGANQAVAANSRTLLSIDAGTKNESQLPSDCGPLWDATTNTITGRTGDSIVAKIQFTFTPDDGTASYVDVEVDIGGAVGVVEDETKGLFLGAGIPHRNSVTFPAFTLDTWQANGGKIYLTSDGAGVVSKLRILILRTHKAR